MKQSSEFHDILLPVSIGIEAFSLFCSLLVPICFILAHFYSNELTKRVSFQLTAVLSIVEALFCAAQIFSNIYITPGFCCSLGTFVYAFTALLSILLSMCIAINLQLVFVYNRRPENVVGWYYGISVFIALCLTLPPFFFNAYGYDMTNDACWYRREDIDITIKGEGYTLYISPYKWCTFYIPSILFIMYSAYASLSVMYKLLSAKKLLSQPGDAQSLKQNKQQQKIIEALVSRLMFYPLVPFLTQFFNIVGELDYVIKKDNQYWILCASYIGTSLQGSITTILFFTVDPAFEKLRSDLVSRFIKDGDGECEVASQKLSDFSYRNSKSTVGRVPVANYV